MSQIAGHLSLPREELSEEWGGIFWEELFNSPCPLSSSLVTGSGEGNGNPLQCSAFFMVQMSHPYMTIGKTLALTKQTLLAKYVSAF